MTVGALMLLTLLGLVMAFAVGGQFAKRIMNGHWGRKRYAYDYGWFAAGAFALAVTTFGAALAVMMVIIIKYVALAWNVQL